MERLSPMYIMVLLITSCRYRISQNLDLRIELIVKPTRRVHYRVTVAYIVVTAASLTALQDITTLKKAHKNRVFIVNPLSATSIWCQGRILDQGQILGQGQILAEGRILGQGQI